MSKAAVASNRGPTVFQAMFPGVSQKVAVGATSTQSTALAATTTLVELTSDVECFVAFGADPTAVADTSLYLQAGISKCYGVTPATKIAVIQRTTSGSLFIAEGAGS